ncbi:non-structural maintenance of chromosomes element 1 homolog isoform X1 [Oncorhynchus mykiss]|uniref:non-structural maintenance of chromosomes element 1 homolog isoform X1 n=1 Tax=Oncorhynchus mykiss TaxID=8022 RepID=UPI0018783C8A|nr:non-structural maintenance of chromosomes element 1 homolog isoform X1 [Oncorhynchus mykiss]XP_021413501.2 non-structural maintenance of chromosomes element 1 homolog isoform X1 [Oncorhynchus mykiss]XP_021413503.2 non-structural maintenance of chromosomes element 1 homolog isoform X1 [Oncorhynchus mykiss]
MARPLGESHKRFLQTMMVNGIIDGAKARALHRHCCETHGAHYAHDKLDEFIDVINAQLQPMFMQIRKGMSEEDGLQYHALVSDTNTINSKFYYYNHHELLLFFLLTSSPVQVNMAETDVTRMSTDYADNELELFRKTMDLIVDSDNGTASSTDILNCADSLQTKKLKKRETEHVLNRLVQDKWLNEKNGDYSLSTRCIMEMEQYIRMLYQDQVKVCHICHNVALQCQMCENPTCGIKIHTPCVARYFKGRTDPRCPACEDFWPHEIPDVYRSPSSQSETQSAAKENTAPTPRSTAQTRRTRRS